MTDDVNDDFEVDNDDLPADNSQVGDDDLDEDSGFSFDGLTQAEIDAMNTDDGDDGDSDNEVDADSDADTDDIETTEQTDDVDTTDADDKTDSADNWQAEAETIATKREAIDTEFDAKIAELEALGKQYDDGEIMDGAYNTAKTRIDRELKRIEAREAELVTKEDDINERRSSAEQDAQAQFVSAAKSFMARPENSIFVEGSPEFIALDQQYGIVAQKMPVGTPYDVILNKARSAVAAYMTLPEVEAPKATKKKPEDKIMPSISGMPSVVANNADSGKFEHLDKLSGQDYENAVAGMSEEQQRQYLHG